MLGSKAKRELKINQRRILIDSIEIGIPSPQQVLTWGERVLPNGKSVGEIKNSKTVNYKRFTPLRDGLFCERIFGPVNSYICACGKRQPRADIKFCDKCEVEYTDQRARRYRLGYIPLVSPVAHIWYLKGRPSYISLFLGKRKKKITALAYCNAYLVEQAFPQTHVSQTSFLSSLNPINQAVNNKAKISHNVLKNIVKEEKNNVTANFDSKTKISLSPIQSSCIEKRQEHGSNEYTNGINSYAKNRQVSKLFYNSTKSDSNIINEKNSQQQNFDFDSNFINRKLEKSTKMKNQKEVFEYKITNKTGPSSFYLLLMEVLGQIEKDLVLIDYTRNKKKPNTKSTPLNINKFYPKSYLNPSLKKVSLLNPSQVFFDQNSPLRSNSELKKTEEINNLALRYGFLSQEWSSQQEQDSFFLKPMWGYTYSKQKSKDLRNMESFINSNRNPISMLSFYSKSMEKQNNLDLSSSTSLLIPNDKSTVNSSTKILRQKIEKKSNNIFSTNVNINSEKSKALPKFIRNFHRNIRQTERENISQIPNVSANYLDLKKGLNSVNLANQRRNLSNFNTKRETEFSTNVPYLQHGINSYNRAHTLPILPNFICKYHLRDDLINFFYSLPLIEDKPIPIYCHLARWNPLRNVHQFMSDQIIYNKDDFSEKQNKESFSYRQSKLKNKLTFPLSAVNQTTVDKESKSLSISDIGLIKEKENGGQNNFYLAKNQNSNGFPALPLKLNKKEIDNDLSAYTTNSLYLKRQRRSLKKNTVAEQLTSARHFLYMALLQKSYCLKVENLANRIRSLSALLTSFSREKFIKTSVNLYPKTYQIRPQFSNRSNFFSHYKIELLENKAKELSELSDNFKNSCLLNPVRLIRLQRTSSLIKFTRSTILHKKQNNDFKSSLFSSIIPSLKETSIPTDSYKPRHFKIISSEKVYSTLLLDNAWVRSFILNKKMSYLPVVTNIALGQFSIAEKLRQFLKNTNRFQNKNLNSHLKQSLTNESLFTQSLTNMNFSKPDLSEQDIIVPSLVHALHQQTYKNKKVNITNKSSTFFRPERLATNETKVNEAKYNLKQDLYNWGALEQSFIDVSLFQRNLIKQNWTNSNLFTQNSTNNSLLNNETTGYSNVNNLKRHKNLFAEEKSLLKNVIVNNTNRKIIWTEEKRQISKNFNITASGLVTAKKTPYKDNNIDSLPEDLKIKPLSIGRLPFSEKQKVNKYVSNNLTAQNHSLSPLELTTIREILAYTGGGALQRLLQRFDTQKFVMFLLADIQATQTLYNKKAIHKGFPSSRIDKRVLTRICRRIYKNSRRLKIAQQLTRCKRRPEWMLISALPVLPPDLRPILQMSESVVVASDLNNLYQRVIYRNNRFQKLSFIDFHLVTAIQRLVQDAVDRLIENGRGGSKPFYTSSGRPLKSLSDTLKGKKGRFRLNLLGKRVDFSGRSVIVVSPNLKIHECGLPREIALELYHYFLLRHFMLKKQASSIVMAKKIIKQRNPSMWNTLRTIIYHHPVLLNRAPTLHRLGIQAFQPKLVRGNAILLHPLVCSGFNADFDGDQMGVHLPLCIQARAEAWDLLWSRNNLLSPATGQPVLVPSQDMVLGFYYMTQIFSSRSFVPLDKKTNLLSDNQNHSHFGSEKENQLSLDTRQMVLPTVRKLAQVHRLFFNSSELIRAFQNGQIFLHTPVWLKWEGKIENDEESNVPLEIRLNCFGHSTFIYSKYKIRREEHISYSNIYARTTAGRVLVNQIVFDIKI